MTGPRAVLLLFGGIVALVIGLPVALVMALWVSTSHILDPADHAALNRLFTETRGERFQSDRRVPEITSLLAPGVALDKAMSVLRSASFDCRRSEANLTCHRTLEGFPCRYDRWVDLVVVDNRVSSDSAEETGACL